MTCNLSLCVCSFQHKYVELSDDFENMSFTSQGRQNVLLRAFNYLLVNSFNTPQSMVSNTFAFQIFSRIHKMVITRIGLV